MARPRRWFCLLPFFFFGGGVSYYILGCPPFPVIVEMKVYRGSLLKNVIILVVTVTGWGDHPNYIQLLPWRQQKESQTTEQHLISHQANNTLLAPLS